MSTVRLAVLMVAILTLLSACSNAGTGAQAGNFDFVSGCVQQSGVRVGPDQRYRRVVAE